MFSLKQCWVVRLGGGVNVGVGFGVGVGFVLVTVVIYFNILSSFFTEFFCLMCSIFSSLNNVAIFPHPPAHPMSSLNISSSREEDSQFKLWTVSGKYCFYALTLTDSKFAYVL